MKRTIIEENLLGLLLHGTTQDLQDTIGTIHPADILDLLHKYREYAQNVLGRLPDNILADIVEEEDGEDKYESLKRFLDSKQRYIPDEMSGDETTNLIGELEEDEQADILERMGPEDQGGVRKLISFDAESAGNIMTTELIRIYVRNTVKDTLQFLRKNTDGEVTYYLYVVDREDMLKGVVSLCDIVISSFDTPITDIVNLNVKAVLYSDDQEEVAHRFEEHGSILMPIVDRQQHMLGVIESDGTIDVIQEENTEDIHHLDGVSKEERVNSGVRKSSSNHTPWLIVSLFTAVLAAAVVDMFEMTIVQAVTSATVMSIVTGMGGNVGTQTSTIVVRGLSLGELIKGDAVVTLLKEIGIDILSGVVIGIAMTSGAMLMESNPTFRLVTGAAMFLNTTLANLAGYFMPVILEKLHVGPALASGVFVTTVASVMGFFTFLGLATLILPHIIQRMMHNMSR